MKNPLFRRNLWFFFLFHQRLSILDCNMWHNKHILIKGARDIFFPELHVDLASCMIHAECDGGGRFICYLHSNDLQLNMKINQNGSKIPWRTNQWADQAGSIDLMLCCTNVWGDQRRQQLIRSSIGWNCASTFWCSNALHIPHIHTQRKPLCNLAKNTDGHWTTNPFFVVVVLEGVSKNSEETLNSIIFFQNCNLIA